MATNFSDVYIRCPFFLTEEGAEIRCEGLLPESQTVLRFKKREWKTKHLENCCREDYERCPLCKGLLEKYEK